METLDLLVPKIYFELSGKDIQCSGQGICLEGASE